MRSREPSLHIAMTTRLPPAWSVSTCFLTASKTLVLASLRSAAKLWPARAPISIVSEPASGVANWVKPRERRAVEAFAPFGFGKIQPVGRQWLIGCAAASLVEGLLAGLIIIGDLRQALVRGFFRERLDRDRRRFEIVEQRLQLPVKQRQPMLDPGGAAALAHRLVEHVVGARRAERRDVAGAKQPDRVRGELELRHGHEVEPAQFLGRALRFRIETADRFQRIAEEIEPHGRVHAGREQIDNAAAYRVVAGLTHRRGAAKAV